ncbi:MAG: cysteine desulfurase [Candidatus Aenigmarchaeota archaeon]|nr:cysteine desulfurase [Candidatus Aenigmarchaeota archaeon]
MKIYLDYAATTPVAPEVREEMKSYFSQKYGNPSSLHTPGQEAKEATEKARAQVAKLINAEPEEIIFTSCATESNNTVLKGVLKPGDHLIISQIEHPCIIEASKYLEKQGVEITRLPVNEEGFVNTKDVENAIKSNTKLVSVMHGNNIIGTVQPIAEIGRICKEREVLYHTDAVQTLQYTPIDVHKMGIDFLTASAHKIYGPKGVGCLYIRKGIRVEPLVHGGGQESGFRSGTENVTGIVGFGKAAELCLKKLKTEPKRISKLRDYLIEGILKNVPDSSLTGPKERLPHNAHFTFKFIEGEALLLRLNEKGIYASTGSACSSKSLEPSPVLLAIGLKHMDAHGSLRMTLGRDTTKEQIDYVLKELPNCVEDLRKISPFRR